MFNFVNKIISGDDATLLHWKLVLLDKTRGVCCLIHVALHSILEDALSL